MASAEARGTVALDAARAVRLGVVPSETTLRDMESIDFLVAWTAVREKGLRDKFSAGALREFDDRAQRLRGGVSSEPAEAPRVGELRRAAPSPGQAPTVEGPAVGWPEPLDLEALAEREPEAPAFIVPDWIPAGYATLFAGHGGVGKSGIALHLAVCVAAGVPFFGVGVERRRVLYLSCEDRERVLHWRLARICHFLGVGLASLRGWLEVLDLVGRETVLWERDPQTGYAITSAYAQLAARVKEQSTQVLLVDGVSDTFGGSENARTEVKRYVNMLLALVPADDGAVVLIGHVAKPTASAPATSEGYSGSTAWHNAVRARWYLYPDTRHGDEAGDRVERTGDLILELQKSNLGPTSQAMRFAWDEAAHLFVGRSITPATPADVAHRDRNDREGILSALRASIAAGVTVPAAASGQRTAYLVLSVRKEFPKGLEGPAGRRRFWRRVEELRAMGAVSEEIMPRSDRHRVRCLVPATEGVRACG